MLYFHSTVPVNEYNIDFSEYSSELDVGRFIYKDKVPRYEELRGRDPKFVPDLAGAVFAAFFRAGYIQKDFFGTGIECCRDIVVSLGFKELDSASVNRHLTDRTDEPIVNHIIIAGCQNNKMLERRVSRAADFVSSLASNCVVVFSGRNPDPTGKTKVKILDESMRMRILFEQELRDRSERAQLPPMHELRVEGGSSNTTTNLSAFFAGNYLKNSVSNNLVIVSSTFHLIRLGEDLKRELSKTANAKKISQVVLVGAEEPKQFFRVQDAPYFKLLMFEVFRFLLKSNECPRCKHPNAAAATEMSGNGARSRGRLRKHTPV
jgi:hypothetical protein